MGSPYAMDALALSRTSILWCNIKENLLKCSGCKSVKYCNAACQKAHWKAHKADCYKQSTHRAEEEAKILTSPSARMFANTDAFDEWERHANRVLSVALMNAFKLWDDPPPNGLPLYQTHILVITLQFNPLHHDVSTSMCAGRAGLISHEDYARTAPHEAETQQRLAWEPLSDPDRVAVAVMFLTSSEYIDGSPGPDCMTSVSHKHVPVCRDDYTWAELREEGKNPRLQQQRGTEKWWAVRRDEDWRNEFNRRIGVSALVEEGEKIAPRVKMGLEEAIYSPVHVKLMWTELISG